jgi:hypothetical protein
VKLLHRRMLLRPKKLWWTFESWRYKNPEANEPSEAGYGMSALRGLAVIVATAILAWLAATKADYTAQTAQLTSPATTPSYTFAPAKPQERGALPIVGYRIDGGYLEIYYLEPDGADATDGGRNPELTDGCQYTENVTGLGTDRVTVDIQLSWIDRYGSYKDATDEKCRVGGTWSPDLRSVGLTQVAPGTTILTNGAVVDPGGKVLKPPAPGNVVPERNA